MIDELVWSESIALGVEDMDSEHKKLIELMNNILHLNRLFRPKEEIQIAFDQFIKYVQKHFEDEEKFMASINFPGHQEHKELHIQLIKKVQHYRNEYVKSPMTKIPDSVFDFFKLWLVSHILVADRKYANYFSRITD